MSLLDTQRPTTITENLFTEILTGYASQGNGENALFSGSRKMTDDLNSGKNDSLGGSFSKTL